MDDRLGADIVVIGAGPAGIAAAVHAADAGRSVLLLDSAPRPGGQIWRHRAVENLPTLGRRWVTRLAQSRVRFIGGSSAAGVEAGPRSFDLMAERAGVPLGVETGAVILATGATELFLPFPGWTEPGVFGVGGLQAMLKAGADLRGQRILVAGSGPLLLPVAAAAVRAGARVTEVLEQAPAARVAQFAAGLWRTPRRAAQALAYRAAFAGTPYRWGMWVSRVDRHAGSLVATVTDGHRSRTIECDLLAVGYGLVPSTELARLLGCAIVSGHVRTDAAQATSVKSVYAAGEATGVAGAEIALDEGRVAGLAAAGVPVSSRRAAGADPVLERTFALRDELRTLANPDTIVCRCEDVRLRDLTPGRSSRHLRLSTRAGMGPCQGRVCGPGLAFVAGTDAAKPQVPAFPVSVATLRAGAVSLTPTGD
jgi:D-hydroxyproline dehydrogenase subunit alpha